MGATSTQPIRTGARAGIGVAKHRACDECPQKQMGRPRKRRIAEKTPDGSPTALAASTYPHVTAQEEPGVTRPEAIMGPDPASLIDPNLGAADTSFLDLLGPDFVSMEPFQAQPLSHHNAPLDRDSWNFDITFDPHYPPPPASSTENVSTQFPPAPSLNTPSPSSQGASTTGQAPDSCNCLAILYLALDSLAHLPPEVGPAIRAARCASKAAHDTIQCQVCSPPLTQTMKVPMATFQNMMILGALIPSIADAYQRILDLVEAETARAICERQQLRFALPEYGGIWGEFGSSGRVCGVTSQYDDVWLEPAMWRLTVRALLKTDVYGLKPDPGRSGNGGLCYTHLGLKDIVGQMDEKSRRRHAEIDALVEAGLPPPTGPNGMPAHYERAQGGEEPPCRRIIKIAGEAVDRLVIA
ncbi:hypothetical protein VM1G_02015 [Cytospora mali]|uniref:Uncharacterized protein n=1 Tax=Cytospora mali TaxID=578113 RepID=A0A194VQR7_CYTMA|nr:hypothetical protein VM1G_02015 [Valsa mali]